MLACTGVCQGTRDREPLVLMGVQHSGKILSRIQGKADHTSVWCEYTGVHGWAHGRVSHCTGVCLPQHPPVSCLHGRAQMGISHTGVSPRAHGRVSGFSYAHEQVARPCPCRFEATQACPLGYTGICSTLIYRYVWKPRKSHSNTSKSHPFFN